MELSHNMWIQIIGMFLIYIWPLVGALKHCPEKCTCRYGIINKSSLDVNCNGANLNALPPKLPTAESYRLYLSHNNISVLEPYSYLHRTDYLDLSHNSLSVIKEEVFIKLLSRVRYLYLHDNNLNCLPLSIKALKLSHIHELSLHANPWSCSCTKTWMDDWLSTNRHYLKSMNIHCTDEYQDDYKATTDSNRYHILQLQPKASILEKVYDEHFTLAIITTLTCIAVLFGFIICLVIMLKYNPSKRLPARDDYTKHKLALLSRSEV